MVQIYQLTTPLSDQDLAKLHIGDKVLLSGTILTGRDAAHKRLVELLDKNQDLPFDIAGQAIYYVGPSPAKPGKVIGSAGPTTSYRMDAYAPKLLAKGLKAMIGKGSRSPAVIEAMKKYKGVYLGAVGGAAALIAKSILSSDIVAYEDLGPEAIRRLTVKDFPAIVINDIYGGDLYQEGVKKYQRN